MHDILPIWFCTVFPNLLQLSAKKGAQRISVCFIRSDKWESKSFSMTVLHLYAEPATCWAFCQLLGNEIATGSKIMILRTHHQIVLSASGWFLWESFIKHVLGHPAKYGTGENEANWSRNCHSLTHSKEDFKQNHCQCTTQNVYSQHGMV